MGTTFKSAEDRVDDSDFQKILDVLGGPSPWQQDIAPNIAKLKTNGAKSPFQIVDSKSYDTVMAALGQTGDNHHTPGVTDKKLGRITMLESFGVNSHAARFGHALHEAVHLVSDPPGVSSKEHSTAMNLLGEGLLEGLVEAVTEDILNAQKIALARASLRGHTERVPVARVLIKDLGTSLLGRLLFGGDQQNFAKAAFATYSQAGWTEIVQLTTANHRDTAIKKMEDYRLAEIQKRAPKPPRVIGPFQSVFR
jgi:hypothetical protein